MLNKLYQNHLKEQEGKAPAVASVETVEEPKQRKPNFFDRKRFVDYEQNADSDNEKSKETLVKEVKAGAIVESVEPPKVESTEEVEEEVMVVSSKKKKTEAVRSAPPKKVEEKPAEVKVPSPKEEIIVDDWEDDWDKPSDRKPADKQQPASSKKSDDYDNWDMSDQDLQDNIEQSKKQTQPPKEVSPVKQEPTKVQTVQFDEIPELKDASPPKEDDRPAIDFFGVNEMKDSDRGDNVDGNPFGQSITKELLQQSKKEIAADLKEIDQQEEKAQKETAAAPAKKNLEIEIDDDNEEYEAINDKAQQNLNDKLQAIDK